MTTDTAPTYDVQDLEYSRDTPADRAHRRHAYAIALQLSHLGPVDTKRRGRLLRSIRSQRIFINCLVAFARTLEVNRAGNLKQFQAGAIEKHLFARSKRVGEAQLKADYWALELWTGRKLPKFASIRPQRLKPRAYTAQQIAIIASHQTPRHAFSTWLAASCGLRSMELITIAPLHLQPRDPRPTPPYLHAYKPTGVLYSVSGKGGLVRTVLVPLALVDELEATRRVTPVRIRHEGSDLTSYYDIPAGKRWAASFTQACRRAFHKTAGGHGLRHTFTQDRIAVLLGQKVSERDARKAVSVEIGHFRPDVIDIYLRGRWDPAE